MLSTSWAAKASTKYETHLLLVTEAKACLPGVEHLTMCKSQYLFMIILPDFMKDIIAGKKKYLKQNKVTQCYVP